MREIEFRAYCKSQKRMLSFEHLKKATRGMVDVANRELAKSGLPVNKLSPYGLFLPLEDDDLIFMQFTGECDKNGKKIFEGDIVEYNTHIGRVAFRFGAFGVITEDGQFFDMFDASERSWFDTPDKWIVIGNIYDNPEILEGV